MKQRWQIGKYLLPVEVIPATKGKLKINWPFNPYWRLLLDEVKMMDGAKFQPKATPKHWTINDNERNRYQLAQLDPSVEWVDPYNNKIPITQRCTFSSYPLWDEQLNAIHHILRYHKVIIAYHMGMGKCLITYTACETIRNPYPIWICCPKNAKLAWLAEWEKWKPNLDKEQILLFNYEKLEEMLNDAKEPPRTIIFDESVYLKNPRSKRSQLASELCRLVRLTVGEQAYIILLCGTPAPKDPTDWWHQTELCCPGFLRESSPTKLIYRLGNLVTEEGEYGPYRKLVSWKKDEVELLYRRLNGLVLVGTKPNEKQYRELNITPDERTLQSTKFIVNSGISNPLIKCREVSDGFIYDEQGNTTYFPSNKLARFRVLLEELYQNEHKRTIIYAAFIASIDKCVETCRDVGWSVIRVDSRGWKWFGVEEYKPKPNQLYKLFQSDNTTPIAIIGYPGSLGEALTLPSDTIIFYSNDFNPKNRQQAEARTRKSDVLIYDLIHLPTDKLVLDTLRRGENLQSLSMGEIVKCLEQEIVV